jgi:lipid II:glycine glycyltransferase (peptidoglycan interpeptide bridge formation enzyme)
MKFKGFRDVQATILVDISRTKDELFKSIERSRRKNVKTALRNDLKFIRALNEEWFAWHKIYCKVWEEGGIEAKPLEFFQEDDYRLYLVKKGSQIIGGGVFQELEDRIIFRAYASLIEFQKYRINDFLYWSSILYAKNKGKKFVDLGGWQIKAKGHLVGINKFKEKWGGKITHYTIYSKNPFYIIGRKMIRNFSSMRWIWDRIKRRPLTKKR